MTSRVVLLVALIGAIVEAQSPCINAGLGPGKDVCCTHHCSQMIVRPVKLPKLDLTELCKPRVVCQQVGGITPLKPIGDLCCCNRAIVTPAHVPKPACHLCNVGCHSASSSCSSSSSSSSSSGSSSVYYHHHHHPSTESSSISHGGSGLSSSTTSITIDESGHPVGKVAPGLIPADPVSLAIAYTLQHSINKVAEDKLSFGFRTMPKEITVIKSVKKIFPEENLFGINGQIVELKPIVVSSSPNIEEEAAEALIQQEEEEEEQEGVAQVKKLTYDEIGFGPAHIKQVPYVQVHGHVDTGSVGSKTDCAVPCNDGYIPGKVIIQPIKKHEITCHYTDEDVYGVDGHDDDDDDGDDDDDEDDDVRGYLRPHAMPCGHYRSCSSCSSSSSSSCSSSSSARHNIIIEKLRCSH